MSLEFSSPSLESVSSIELPEKIVSIAAKVEVEYLPEVMEEHQQQLSTSEEAEKSYDQAVKEGDIVREECRSRLLVS